MRNETNKPQLSQLVGTYFIKLANLSALIHQAYAGSDATDINFFIDVYSIKKTILRSDFITSSDNELCSLIMDMVVFYKNYFRGIGVHVNFYIIDSNNVPANNRQIFPSYNSDFVIALTSKNVEYIEYNMDLVKILCDYLPDITYIKTKFESSVVMADIIGLCGSNWINNKPNIVLSKDPYCMMLVNIDGTGNTTWIRPKKCKGVDNSYICSAMNLHYIVEHELGVTKMNPDYRTGIGGMLSAIFACTKFPARCIPPIMQYRTFMSILSEIRNNHFGVSLTDILSSEAIKTKISEDEFDKRYMVLDIPAQHNFYRSSTEFAVNSNPAPKMTDIEGLKHINNNYFSNNPLMLDDLLK